MTTEPLAIVRAIHDRYDGVHHNPWNEIECGDHYARALASWGCLLGVCGFEYDGPAKRIGFAPRMTPGDFKALFTAAEGWGTLAQRRSRNTQVSRLDVKWGRVPVKTFIVELSEDVDTPRVSVTAAAGKIEATVNREGNRLKITLSEEVEIRQGNSLAATITW
jgi:hypothetical protein